MIGDAKAVACIEDTAVSLDDLPAYIAEVETLLQRYDQRAVYYAHAGAGELHLRPVLDLKTAAGRADFYHITRDVARLVKKYRGSLSGEHGDGRVRAPFLPEQLGPEVYAMLGAVKRAWDPRGILNPGKIVDPPPMTEDLRYAGADAPAHPHPATGLDFAGSGGMLAAAERCNGSGDCRKLSGGAMCPSYRASRLEKDSTRGRANVLREILTRDQRANPFDHPALAEALDRCLGCKACTAECPSTVNLTDLKAESLHQRHRATGIPARTRLLAANDTLYRLGGYAPGLANLLLRSCGTALKRLAGVAPQRSLPPVPPEPLRRWYCRERPRRETTGPRGEVWLFGDEFSDRQDTRPGQDTLRLLWRLGYRVHWPAHGPSGRAELSLGLLDRARARAAANVRTLAGVRGEIVGIEPSALLSLRDEYPRLLRGAERETALRLAGQALTLAEWLHRRLERGELGRDDFGDRPRRLALHVHCHQRALGSAAHCAAALAAPRNFHVTLLDSGCCGMAGSFGYATRHYALSRAIAEDSLLGRLRKLPPGTQLVAAGTSCRHQVRDLASVNAIHPASALLTSFENTTPPT